MAQNTARSQRTRVQADRNSQIQFGRFCPKTGVVYEFFGCYFHGHTCQLIRDVITMDSDTLAERYERTMARTEKNRPRGLESRNTLEVRV